MTLDEYRRKRDFRKSPEPAPKPSSRTSSSSPPPKPRFVVQEHHASHLHWDFRLEMDGVLRSWAVPKGPPLEPGVRRLAVQTEDHPLEYIDFEGVIPPGQYGAGTVRIWDRGTYELVKRTPDEIEVVLHGQKLRGPYVLVRMKNREKDWLLLKRARPEHPDGSPSHSPGEEAGNQPPTSDEGG